MEDNYYLFFFKFVISGLPMDRNRMTTNALTIEHGQPSVFIKEVASPAKVRVDNKTLVINSKLVSGFFKTFSLGNSIECLCAKYDAREDFYVNKIPTTSEIFTLRIHEVSPGANRYKLNKNGDEAQNQDLSQQILLLSSLKKFAFSHYKNSKIKTLEIAIPREYFFSRLNFSCSYDTLKKYLGTKYGQDSIQIGTSVFGNIFRRITGEIDKPTAGNYSIKQNIKRLLEVFFSDINERLNDFAEYEKIKISREEVLRLMVVRKYLDRDMGFSPPNFSLLTKMALMSSTSLKTKFKKMYGTTLFEYFQRMRMQRARILLLTHKFSVKQVGNQLGYSNHSNFTIAFKKEFHHLPHELIK